MTGRNRSIGAASFAASVLMLFGLAVGATGATNDARMLSDVSVDDIDGTTVVSLYGLAGASFDTCLLYTSPSPRDQRGSRMPSSA